MIAVLGDIHINYFTEGGLNALYKRIHENVPPVTNKCRDKKSNYKEGLSHGVEHLILLGDVCDGIPTRDEEIKFLLNLADLYTVHMVLGNHDYYGRSVGVETTQTIIEFYRKLGISVYENEVVNIDGKRVGFTTLWAGLDKLGDEHNTTAIIKDFEKIDNFSVEQCRLKHSDAVEFIKTNYDSLDIIITHFAPSYMSQAAHHKTSPSMIAQYFYTELLNYGTLCNTIHNSNNRVTWVHGHTHDECEYRVTDKLTVMCASAGQSKIITGV